MGSSVLSTFLCNQNLFVVSASAAHQSSAGTFFGNSGGWFLGPFVLLPPGLSLGSTNNASSRTGRREREVVRYYVKVCQRIS